MTDPSALFPPGLHFLQRGWLSSNSVLLRDEQRAILIDTGYWTHAEQIVDLIDHSLGGRPLDLILNTHLHSDHCGGNATLQAHYPQVEVRVPPGLADAVFDWDPSALSYAPTGQHCPKFKADGIVQPGDRFEVANLTWEAHAAPGHDPDSLIFFCASRGILISADALWENGFGVVFPEIEGVNAFDDVGKTLDLIEALAPKLVLPGHGNAFADCHSAIERARRRLQGFVSNPERHALYAAKVLLKFKLLELQRISQANFLNWAQECELMQLLHKQYAPSRRFADWYQFLLGELVSSHAATLTGDEVLNA